jgi:integrase
MRFGLGLACRFFGGAEPDSFPWHRVRVDQIAALRADLAVRFAPNTANKILSALKGVLKASWRMGLMTGERYFRCVDIRSVKGGPRERGQSLSRDELRALFAACAADPTPRGRRDAAVLAVLYGCRRSEPVALDVADYDDVTGRLRIRGAKGNKDRDVYLANGTKRAMDDWLEVRGDEPGPLLNPVDSIGRIRIQRLSDQAMYQICKRLAATAGVQPFSPHDLRRTFAGDMLDAGADVAIVQRLMGHANIGSTAGYDRRGAETTRATAELMSVPYR